MYSVRRNRVRTRKTPRHDIQSPIHICSPRKLQPPTSNLQLPSSRLYRVPSKKPLQRNSTNQPLFRNVDRPTESRSIVGLVEARKTICWVETRHPEVLDTKGPERSAIAKIASSDCLCMCMLIGCTPKISKGSNVNATDRPHSQLLYHGSGSNFSPLASTRTTLLG